MILECSDLERALRTPELMPDMRAHAEQCERCREQLYLWGEISRLAPGLHQEWESPFLWQRIQANLAAEPVRRGSGSRPQWWRWALAATGTVVLAAAMLQPMWQTRRSCETGGPGAAHRKRTAGSTAGGEGICAIHREAVGGGRRKTGVLFPARGRGLSREADSAGCGDRGVECGGRQQPVQHLLADGAGCTVPAEATDSSGMVK